MNNLTKGMQIAWLIREINSKINHNIRNEFKDSGLTVQQITLLKLLSRNGRLKVSEISKKMSLVNSTVSGIIDRLEKQELVVRNRSEKDKRIVYIELSDKGSEIIAGFRVTIDDYFDSLFSDTAEDDIEIILEGLRTLKGVLDE